MRRKTSPMTPMTKCRPQVLGVPRFALCAVPPQTVRARLPGPNVAPHGARGRSHIAPDGPAAAPRRARGKLAQNFAESTASRAEGTKSTNQRHWALAAFAAASRRACKFGSSSAAPVRAASASRLPHLRSTQRERSAWGTWVCPRAGNRSILDPSKKYQPPRRPPHPTSCPSRIGVKPSRNVCRNAPRKNGGGNCKVTVRCFKVAARSTARHNARRLSPDAGAAEGGKTHRGNRHPHWRGDGAEAKPVSATNSVTTAGARFPSCRGSSM